MCWSLSGGGGGGWLWRWAAFYLSVLVLALSLSGCIVAPRGPRACGPGGCPAPPMCPQVGGVPASHYAEPMWPYYDPAGVPRVMGDTRLRSHLGLGSGFAPVAE